MIEFTVESIDGANIDGEFQLSILAAKTGQTISRTDISEQPNFDKIEYLEDYKINKSLNNYLFMKGKVKVCYEWDETNGIEQRDVDKIIELNRQNPEDKNAIETLTDNSYCYEIDYGGYVTEWRERSTNYELSSHKSSITSLQDDTVLICCLQEDYGYKFYNVDIQPNESIETNKIGDTTYLLVGEECEVTVPATNKTHTFNQYDCKKLTSNNCSIKNISNNICRVVMICK
tara:strand:+ start:226 stop:918 length:693 start_codon:yes stop_codon:yes gene_type:complete